MLRRTLVTGLALWGLLAASAAGQTISGTIRIGSGSPVNLNGGTPYANNANIVIDLDDYGITDGAITEDVTIRLVGSDLNTVNLGSLTVNGSLGSGTAKLSLLLASDTSFPVTGEVPLAAAFKNCGPITVSDSSLRDSTRAAIAIEGDLTGAITLGHIRRLQVTAVLDGEDEYDYGGELLGAVTATAENGSVVTGTGVFVDHDDNPGTPDVEVISEPMAYVSASKRISGALTATAGDIGIVSIGSTTTATDGLQANVQALAGQIKSIYCAGAIGNPTASPAVMPEIWAMNKIGEIIADVVPDPLAFEALDRDFHVSIKSGIGRPDTDSPVSPFTDGSLHLIRTNGDLTGVIDVRNITARDTYGVPHAGILVGGACNAPINVLYTVHGADIVAASFSEPITIGVQLKGSIVAFAPEGVMESVTIGYNFSDQADVYTGEENAETSVAFYRGFMGTDLPPKDDALFLQDPSRWLLPNNPACFDPEHPLNLLQLGSMDSVIRAHRIDSIAVRSMATAAHLSDFKKGRPRIEAVSIGSCRVDYMRAGVIWSGLIEFIEECNCETQAPCFDNDPTNDYSSIESLEIGCLSKYAAVWYQDCERAVFVRSVYGSVHVPELTQAQTLWIGDSLGEVDEDPLYPGIQQCLAPSEDGLLSLTVHPSPELGPDTSPRHVIDQQVGHIYVHDVEGLEGQIIINGNNNGGTWDGVVVVGEDDDELRITLGPAETDPLYLAPHYTMPSGPLGGGAVGLAPFAFYPTDCTPVHDDLSGSIMYTEFEDGAVPVIARWYGPVELPEGEEFEGFETLAALLNLDCAAPGTACDWYLLDSMFSYVKHPDGQKRAIGIKTQGGAVPKDGRYRISYEAQSAARLVSHDVVDSPFVGLFPTGCDLRGYLVYVDADCDSNDVPDSQDIINGGLDGEGIPVLDQNQNGILDECDGMMPTCACDWDQNGRIGVSDIFAFLASWFANEPDARCFGVENPPSPPTNPPCGVPAIFSFLNCWFALGPTAICD